jgi:hypothetical protein
MLQYSSCVRHYVIDPCGALCVVSALRIVATNSTAHKYVTPYDGYMSLEKASRD